MVIQLFSKSLTTTDVRRRLAIPTRIVNSLLPNGGDHAVELHVWHGTTEWRIMCTTRKEGYKKPVFSRGWRHFALENKLKVGDVVTLYKEEHEAGHLYYRIEVKRADEPSFKHSVATAGNLLIGNSDEASCKSHRRFEDGVVKQFDFTDEKVEKSSFKLFGIHVVENQPRVDASSYEAPAGKSRA
ncbi:hypothetical protein SLEP1_g40817 [Rubroshorea leprosula]|uniref:TF-B3 domain-containing protein n=1 Tax=Rubroshorea leprosula TaxID=152421 RepID=A0AAV5L5H5_9ROSI|nr:hypothetical protein SLEP1_g40817 [Rubroshorea leprosula]